MPTITASSDQFDLPKFLRRCRVLLVVRLTSAFVDIFLMVLGLVIFIAGWGPGDFFEFCDWLGASVGLTLLGLGGFIYELCGGPRTIVSCVLMAVFYLLVGCCIMGEIGGSVADGAKWEAVCLTFGALAWCLAIARAFLTWVPDVHDTDDELLGLLTSQGTSSQAEIAYFDDGKFDAQRPAGGWNTFAESIGPTSPKKSLS